MLELLRVRAFAIIEELEVHFAPALNVLTGETGAGKSILVDALHLVLGGRAQSDVVRTGAEEAEVQALFRPRDPGATDARLQALGLPAASGELVVRRTVQREGRSRAWVNGALATAAQLAQATRGLLDISGQHEHVGLLDAQTHLALLDAYAGLSVVDYEAAFVELAEAERVRARLDSDESARAERASFLRYQLDELEKADPKAGEDEVLAQERRVLAAAEKLRGGAEEAEALLRSGDAGGILARRRGGAGRARDGADRDLGAVRARAGRRDRRGGRGSRAARTGKRRAAALAEPGRGAAALGANRFRRRAVARPSGGEARPSRRGRRGHVPLRRGGRRDWRRDGGRRGTSAVCGGARQAGDLHHASAADRRVRGATPGRRERSRSRADAQSGGSGRRRGARSRTGAPPLRAYDAGRARACTRVAGQGASATLRPRAAGGVR